MSKAALWGNIPAVLRARRQWCVANPNDPDVPSRKAPRQAQTYGPLAKVDEPSHWSTFDQAARFAYEKGWNIGYVLSAEDAVCCVDLDVKDVTDYPNNPEKWTTEEDLARHLETIEQIDSYTEKSLSGKAYHVWVEAKIGPGAKHAPLHIEIYSQERFIICTGDVYRDKPIENRQELIEVSVEQIRALQSKTYEKKSLVEVPESIPDIEIWTRSIAASNGSKFRDLCEGDWAGMGYKSQSEADLALLSIFAFYSKSNLQVRRLFRLTKLGARQKAQQNDRYLNDTLVVIRSRQDAQQRIDISVLERAAQEAQDARRAELDAELATQAAAAAPKPHLNGHSTPVAADVAPPVLPGTPSAALPWPPGFVGEIAEYIYANAPRPVREVAIVSALGLVAGVCGLAWSLPQSGLNLYLVLIARSAIGKEAMHTGISTIVGAVMRGSQRFQQFVDFNEYASGQALKKAAAKNRSFVSVSGEWGHTLEKLAASERNPSMQTLRQVMTNLYQKSGPGSMVGGLTYSNKDENIASVNGIAFSMIGETTPVKYYDSLTQSMLEDGFLSRFTMVEYSGNRVELSEKEPEEPPPHISSRLTQLGIQADAMITEGKSIRVQKGLEAAALFKAYDKYCDNEINTNSENEAWRQMWNRAHLKSMRIAALFAVCENDVAPIINKEQALWAIDLVNRDIELMKKKFDNGEIGQGDGAREAKLMYICKEYLIKEPPPSARHNEKMRKAGVVTRAYLQMRTCSVSAFYNHALGATRSMDMALMSLCESGRIKELKKEYAFETWNSHGKLYAIIDQK